MSRTADHGELPMQLKLEGGLNFRDIGGYPTRDGRRVRHGMLYRSGSMAKLTDADQAHLHERGIRFVWDLRSNRERERQPFPQPVGWAADYRFRDYDNSTADLRAISRRTDAEPEHTRALMIQIYKALPYEQADAYRAVFEHVAAGDLPLAFNCAAGKDRTGVAAALLLDTLGVDRATILRDYLISATFADRLWSDLSQNYPELRTGTREVWEPLLRCEQEYLDTMFQTIEARHGSVAGYLEEELKLDAPSRQAIRDQLLEPAP